MNITPDEQELKNKLYSKIHDPYSWRLVHDLDTDLTGDAMYDIMNLITLHTQRAERLAQNKMQVDSALHVEEYHYHRLNDVKIGNASVEELITDSKRRIAQLTNPTEAGEL